MRYEIDLRDVRTREAFHRRIEQTVPCPAYYGRNLDAFYDILTGQNGIGELFFYNVGDFMQNMPDYAEALKTLCAEAMEQRPELRVRFGAEESE